MRQRFRRGFTLTEILLASAIFTITISLGVSSFILGLGALRTGSDALLLQREADQILNMTLAPEIRIVQTIVSAGENELVYQYLSPSTGLFETNAIVFRDGNMFFCRSVPYYKDYPEIMDDYMENLSEQTYGAEVLGRFVEDFLFSFRDGANSLVSMTGGFVDDPTAIEIVDIRLTLARDRQVYQITNSFIPIRQFI